MSARVTVVTMTTASVLFGNVDPKTIVILIMGTLEEVILGNHHL